MLWRAMPALAVARAVLGGAALAFFWRRHFRKEKTTAQLRALTRRAYGGSFDGNEHNKSPRCHQALICAKLLIHNCIL